MTPRRIAVFCLVLAFLVSPALISTAAHDVTVVAVAQDAEAKKKLAELKAKLPDLLQAWAKDDPSLPPRITAELRVCRMTGPDQAKLSVTCTSENRKTGQKQSEIINAFLRYHDGCWTTTQYDTSWAMTDLRYKRALFALLLAIDEAAGR
jgi:hypothetical protein